MNKSFLLTALIAAYCGSAFAMELNEYRTYDVQEIDLLEAKPLLSDQVELGIIYSNLQVDSKDYLSELPNDVKKYMIQNFILTDQNPEEALRSFAGLSLMNKSFNHNNKELNERIGAIWRNWQEEGAKKYRIEKLKEVSVDPDRWNYTQDIMCSLLCFPPFLNCRGRIKNDYLDTVKQEYRLNAYPKDLEKDGLLLNDFERYRCKRKRVALLVPWTLFCYAATCCPDDQQCCEVEDSRIGGGSYSPGCICCGWEW